jgi:hypothetical protein
MILRLALPFAISLLTGLLLARLLGFPRIRGSAGITLTLCFALGLGLGVSSLLAVLWVAAFRGFRDGIWIAELGMLLLLGTLNLWVRRGKTGDLPAIEGGERGLNRVLLAGVLVLLLVFLAVSALVYRVRPHGIWDAWAIWNLRARFLVRAGGEWAAAFSPFIQWSHPDYPLLLPSLVARAWSYLSRESTLAPLFVSVGFGLITTGLLGAALRALRSRAQGWIAAAVLLGTPFFLFQGPSQLADLPLGFFLLLSLTSMALHDRLEDAGPGLMILAGLAAGLAAWTKNEGLLFLLALLAARAAAFWLCRANPFVRRRWVPILIGFLPVLLVLLVFKVALAPPNDLMAGQGWTVTLKRILSLKRHGYVAWRMAKELMDVGRWGVFIVALPWYGLFVGAHSDRRSRLTILTAVLTLALVLIGYHLIYVTTPLSLSWHIETSLSRLYIGLWPSVLFTLFLWLREPERFPGREPVVAESSFS